MNPSRKIREQLGWRPRHGFEQGLAETVAWYRANSAWSDGVRSGAYRDYYEQQYARRLAVGAGGGNGNDQELRGVVLAVNWVAPLPAHQGDEQAPPADRARADDLILLKKLIEAGIREILIVTGTEHMGDFVELLGSGPRARLPP